MCKCLCDLRVEDFSSLFFLIQDLYNDTGALNRDIIYILLNSEPHGKQRIE